jgi:hypothetical protein
MYLAQCATLHTRHASKNNICSEMNRWSMSGAGNTTTCRRRGESSGTALCAVFNPIQVSSMRFEAIAAGVPAWKRE